MAAMVDERGTQARPDRAEMTGKVECRYYGRDFTADKMALLRALIAADPPPNRHALSREFCRRIGWFKPDGGLKDMMARVTMLAMHRDGLIVLPPPKWPRPPRRPMAFGPDTEPPPEPAPAALDEVRPLDLRPAVRYSREGKLWNEFVARYHYLGYRTLVGAQMRYAVHDRDGRPIAMLGLPPPKWPRPPRRPMVFGPDTEPPPFPAPTTLDEVCPLSLRPVARYTREGKRWNEFVARYHYLGYKTLVGAQMRYAVHDRHGAPLAMLGFSTAARKLAPRDSFIGWTPQLREKNLPLVIDNPRFLILPWITIPNLGSHILSLVRRQLPDDWTERYNTTPVLIETFVETPRFTGALYKASGWTLVGTTKGRGRYDRHTRRDQPKKDIWLRPLRKDWRRTLNR